jgi:16S rRNA (uracil1498-N3)-methyltransferase
MQLFYAPEIADNQTLPRDEAVHCLRTLRLHEGDTIDVTDGHGAIYRAAIAEAKPDRCRLTIIDKQILTKSWPFVSEIAIAPTKNADRTEWFAEKAVEIGIDRISLLRCRNSERREMKTDRLRRVMVAAMKQSLKATLPEIGEMTDFETFVNRDFQGQKFIAHCREGVKPLLSKVCRADDNFLLLIGPEGDFSAEEVELAEARGFVSVSLGENRLRTETAALTGLITAHLVKSEE